MKVNREKHQKLIVVGVFLVSVLYAGVEVLAALEEQATSGGTSFLWSILFAVVMALWTSNDAKTRGLYKPYEYSYLVFLFWPFVLPYHLIKTWGAEGLLMFLGVLGIYFLPFISGLAAWAYFT